MLDGSEYISGKKAFKVLSFLYFQKSSLILGELISMQALMVKWNCSVKALLVELFPIVNSFSNSANYSVFVTRANK